MTGRAGAVMERSAVTVFDVAHHAGASAATVSRVLLGRAIVAADTRASVLQSVATLGYRPNPLAQGLRMGRGHVVALLSFALLMARAVWRGESVRARSARAPH